MRERHNIAAEDVSFASCRSTRFGTEVAPLELGKFGERPLMSDSLHTFGHFYVSTRAVRRVNKRSDGLCVETVATFPVMLWGAN